MSNVNPLNFFNWDPSCSNVAHAIDPCLTCGVCLSSCQYLKSVQPPSRRAQKMPREDDEIVADQEERMINEEYKIWKKNTPFLYGALCLLLASISLQQ